MSILQLEWDASDVYVAIIRVQDEANIKKMG